MFARGLPLLRPLTCSVSKIWGVRPSPLTHAQALFTGLPRRVGTEDQPGRFPKLPLTLLAAADTSNN